EKLTVSGNNASRVFDIEGGATVTIAGLTVADGSATGAVTGPEGPLTLGGGILNNQSHLTGSGAALTHNQVGGFIGAGGAVANGFGASLTIDSCTFTGNLAGGQAVDSPGGAVFSDAGSTVAIDQSTFTGNRAIDGGGLAVWGGSA